MKWLYTLSILMFVSTAHAEVSQSEVSAMLDKMVKEGTISAVEAEKAKAKMGALSGKDWSVLNQEAEKVVAQQSRAPASIKESKTGDLDLAQMNQIQDDIKKIMPNFDR